LHTGVATRFVLIVKYFSVNYMKKVEWVARAGSVGGERSAYRIWCWSLRENDHM